ncbi:MAG: histidine kinase [Bacteroidales bacterium]|nr:histidine kinase [Bacteroidales bacterium]
MIGIEIALWVAFSIMQSGPVVGTLEYGVTGGPLQTLWLMVPFSLFCLVVVLVTTRIAIPRLLMRREWWRYGAITFALSYVFSLIEQIMIMYIWVKWNIIPDGMPVSIGGLLLNTLSNSLMFFFTLLAVGGGALFVGWNKDLVTEHEIARNLDGYLRAVKNQLHPEELSHRLRKIADMVEESPREGEAEIARLCADLRRELYHLPVPPRVSETERSISSETPFNRWLIGHRSGWQRHLVFQISLLLICVGAFFSTPDHADVAGRFDGFIVLWGMFEIMAGVVVYIFFRRFRRKRRLGGFILSVSILAMAVLTPLIVERMILFLRYSGEVTWLFVFITALAALGAALMIIFYLGGISTILLYQDWLKESRRIVLLNAATRRLEYARLKKQINPHFLFNILNNASILADYDGPEARRILVELDRLIRYQFRETESDTIPLPSTIEFLKAYLALESIRRDHFSFDVKVSGECQGVELPTLLFIPFVENAVKYATPIEGRDMVEVEFRVGKKQIEFLCRNPYTRKIRRDMGETGGIGLSNTLRRLELIYDDEFSYTCGIGNDSYLVRLIIPNERQLSHL